MASTSATGPPDVLKEIYALFDWNPPELVPEWKPKSTTRPPSFFDKHLPDKYVLKRVRPLPTLATNLDEIVNTALEAAFHSLPSLGHFVTARQREANEDYLSDIMSNKKGVVGYYAQTTARCCSPVASTLGLHPTASFSEWRSLVSWTQSVSSSDYAIMDGQLCFTKVGNKKLFEDDLVDTIKKEYRDIVKEMRKSKSPLATWEMKSLTAGSIEVMTSILNLGNFDWKHCLEYRRKL